MKVINCILFLHVFCSLSMCKAGGEKGDLPKQTMKKDTIPSKYIEALGSTDGKVSDEAFNYLVSRKSEAIPALLNVLSGNNQKARYLAVAAIASIGDSSVADMVFDFLDDSNEKVRAWSAIALKRMNDPRALSALLKTIDDYPDESHYDQTLTTYALIQWGEEILPHMISLLNFPNKETRIHSFSVIKKVVFNSVKTKEKWEEIWKLNGSYDTDMSEYEREICVKKWQNWLSKK